MKNHFEKRQGYHHFIQFDQAAKVDHPDKSSGNVSTSRTGGNFFRFFVSKCARVHYAHGVHTGTHTVTVIEMGNLCYTFTRQEPKYTKSTFMLSMSLMPLEFEFYKSFENILDMQRSVESWIQSIS